MIQAAIEDLIPRYDAILMDAYGVLVTHDTVLPGAPELIRHLNETGKSYSILTNDASRSPQNTARRYAERGLLVPPDRIITSGMLIQRCFATNGLQGASSVVLGPQDSVEYVRAAGGRVVELTDSTDAEVLVLCDERGYPFLETMDRVLGFLYRRFDAARPVKMILPNPDLVYPAGHDRYGFTAGAMALMVEAALFSRYPERSDLEFVPLGKPHPPMFEEAFRRMGTKNAVMIGDQMASDILGARMMGIDTALILTGLSLRPCPGTEDSGPTYLLDSLQRASG